MEGGGGLEGTTRLDRLLALLQGVCCRPTRSVQPCIDDFGAQMPRRMKAHGLRRRITSELCEWLGVRTARH